MSSAEINDLNSIRGQVEEVDLREDSVLRVGLFIDRDPQKMVVTVEPNSSEELPFAITVDRDHAVDAYKHPYPYLYSDRPPTSLAPSINPKPTRWDRALDQLNELPPEARKEAIQQVDKVRGKSVAVPTLMFDAVRKQREQRQLDQAA